MRRANFSGSNQNVDKVTIRNPTNNELPVSIFSDLFSLEGLITIPALVFTFKSLKINNSVNRQNVNINGDGNIVIYNQDLESTRHSFKLLWTTLAALIFFCYPIFGDQINELLKIISYIGAPISACAFVVNIRKYGTSRAWDLLYVLGALAGCWLSLTALPFLQETARRAASIYQNLINFPHLRADFYYLSDLANFALEGILFPTISVIGVVFLFVSTAYLVFAYISARNFDQALTFSFSLTSMTIIGYVFSCNALLAIYLKNFEYLKTLLKAPVTFG